MPDKEVITFGAVFNKSFVQAVLLLQNGIQNIITENNYTLGDICFAPLAHPDDKGVDKCVVQSIWGYFENDMSVLEDDKYLEKFMTCTQ